MKRVVFTLVSVISFSFSFAQSGSLDYSFDPGTGYDGKSVYALALEEEGKVIVGGSYATFNDTVENYISRLLTNGVRDTSFDCGTGFNGHVYALQIQPNGKIITGGYFTTFNGVTCKYITRLNSDCTIDPTFDTGITGLNHKVNAVALQTDGSIIVGGRFSTFNGIQNNYIIRLNSDGSADNTFNTGTGFNGTLGDIGVHALALQTDGRVIVGGGFSSYNGTSINNIVRLNTDGSIDATFNVGTGFSGNNGIVYALALQADGKIIVGGKFGDYNGLQTTRIARLNSDGSFDSFFNTGSGFNGQEGVTCLSLQPDGKIIVGGNFISYNSTSCKNIARLNADGTFDNTFDTGNGFTTGITGVEALALQPDTKVIVGGGFPYFNGISRNKIARLNGDGLVCALDTSVTELGSALQANAANLSYQWLDCNNSYAPVIGATQQLFNPASSSGIYAVIISDGACSDSSNCHEVIAVGINEIEGLIKIYPNPVKSEITVNGYSPAYIMLSDAVGQTVAKSPSNKLYVGNLSQGLYVLQLFDENGTLVKTEKLIKD